MPNFGPRWTNPREHEKGGQGLTYLVNERGDESNTEYLAKVLNNPKPDRKERFLQEIAVTKEFKGCPYVVQNVDSGTTQNSGWPYFVMPFYPHGTLEDNYDNLGTLLDRLELFLKICKGVEYAHAQQLVHRDLKPSNIFLLTPQHPVVGDFGLCYRNDKNNEERVTITPEAVGARKYMPPEAREGRTDDPKVTSDIYSLGKILYWLFMGTVYDGHEDDHVAAHPILVTRKAFNNPGPEVPDRWVIAKDVAQELVNQTIIKDESKRISIAEELVKRVQAGIDRIERNGRVLDFNLPKTCLFCGKGTYQLPAGMPYPTREKERGRIPIT